MALVMCLKLTHYNAPAFSHDDSKLSYFFPLFWTSFLFVLSTYLLVCVFVVPDAPRFFRINRRSFDTIYLEWDKPLEPNGILIGYQLKYQIGELL